MPSRQFSPYEKNHLLSFGVSLDNLAQYGEMPVEYITGKAIFLTEVFKVTSNTLIPRLETEELVELIMGELLATAEQWQTGTLQLAEIGTGSGVIGLSLAKFLETQQLNYHLTLSDLDLGALKVAQQNQANLLPSPNWGRLNFLVSDLLSAFPVNAKFDLIVANLPYIPSQRIATLTNSVKDYEPVLALDGGEAGLDQISRLLHQAQQFLTSTGKVYLELDHTHDQSTFSLIAKDYDYQILKDSFGQNRFGIFTLKKTV